MATLDRRGATVSAADPPIGTNPNPDLAFKAPVRAATTGGNITLNGLQTIDGIVLAAGDRVLVKDQTDQTTNGLYNVATGPWTRTIDANNNSQLTTGTQVLVAVGTINANGVFKLMAAVPIVLGTSALTWALGAPPATVGGLTIAPTANSTNQGLTVNQTGAGTVGPFVYNSIVVTDSLNAGNNAVDGLSIFHGVGGSSAQGARQALQCQVNLFSPTSPSNPNRYYVAGIFQGVATTGDGGTAGAGNQKGLVFGLGSVAWLQGGATQLVECSAAEFDTQWQAGSSANQKYGVKINQNALDAVSGSINDAALFMGAQAGAVGWGTLWQIGDGANQNPLKTTGSIVALKGAPTFANGIDLSGAASITGSAFKSPGFSVDGSGNVTVTNTGAAQLNVNNPSAQFSVINLNNGGIGKAQWYWDNTNGVTFLTSSGAFKFNILGTTDLTIFASGGVGVGSGAADPGAGNFVASQIYVNNATFMLRTKTSFANGAGGGGGTLTNAPAAGNPTKWIAIDDNGTTRQIPAW